MSVLIDPTATTTVLHEVGRLLLTIGVGLFLGYLVLIVGANLFGLVPRYASRLTHRKQALRHAVPSQPAPSQPAETLLASGRDRKETRA